jgi:hypothetical protein
MSLEILPPQGIHQGIRHLADTLRDACEAVFPDCEFLNSDKRSIDIEVVLHEVLQGILLKLYLRDHNGSPNLDVTFDNKLRPLEVGPIFVPVTEINCHLP